MQRAVRAGVGLALGLAVPAPFALRPCDGGVLELSGVFGGRVSLSRSAAFSASKAATRAANASTRANNAMINASFSDDDNWRRSGRGVMERLTHIPTPGATRIDRWR